MKFSKFNIIIKDGNEPYIWNTKSNAVSKLDDPTFQRLAEIKPEFILPDDFPFLDYMSANGFVVDDEFDETGEILREWSRTIDDTAPSSLSITLAPGMGCNYNCPYCFENGKRGGSRMTYETADAVVWFIRKKIDSNPSLKTIALNGFGGEPLMYIDVFERICHPLIRLCDERGIRFKGHVITNAYFLTDDIVDRLVKCRISSAQVSIDGMPEVYAAGKGVPAKAFYRVVDNIVTACNRMRISVRVNVPRDGLDNARELRDYLMQERGLDGKISIYIANTRLYGASLETEKANFANWCEMDKKFIESFDPDKGSFNFRSLTQKISGSHSSPCKNICRYNACIGPEGELYPCEHYFGDGRYVCGSIFSGANDTEISEEFRKVKLPDNKDCGSCALFPVCMGGCPDDNIHSRNIIECDMYREHLVDRKLLEIRIHNRLINESCTSGLIQ